MMKRKLTIALILSLVLCMGVQPVSAAKVKAAKITWKTISNHKTLKAGEKYKLTPLVMPQGASQKVTYKSDKPAVAKVSKKGNITAKSKGKAVITVKAKKSKVSAKYYIHVGKKVKKIKWINTQKTKDVYIGEPFTFKAECTTKKAAYKKVVYKSSKSSVLKISKKGVATPKKNGTATITAYAADQSGKKVKCKVTVRTKVTKVKLTATYKTCFIGAKLTLKKAITPDTASDKEVSWKSADKNIATVSSKGVVKGKASGKVKITATAKDGSKKKGSYTVYVRGSLDPASERFIAHRGLSSRFPENTMQAFAGASAERFFGVETDIWENGTFYQTQQGDDETWIKGSTDPFKAVFDLQQKEDPAQEDSDVSDPENENGNTEEPGNDEPVKEEYETIEDVIVDDELINEGADYEKSESGGTAVIKLTPDYLEGLDAGNHVLSVSISGIDEGRNEEKSFTIRIDPQLQNPGFIIMHDENIERMCGVSLKVQKLTDLDIGTYKITKGNGYDSGTVYKIPLLADYLNTMKPSGKTAVIEVKDDDLSEKAAEELIAQVDESGLKGRVYFGSFSKDSLLTLQKKLAGRTDIKLTRFLGARDKGSFESEIKWCIDNDMDQVSIHKDYIKQSYVTTVKSSGMEMGAWVVDDERRAADLLLMGCDCITTNSVLW